jgi:protocatechuate 3,4-dioxygenase beta subunit
MLFASLATLAVGCKPTPSLLDTHEEDQGTDSNPGETGQDTGAQDTGPFDTGTPAECRPTRTLDEGPNFRANAPERKDLRTLDEQGTSLLLRLQVRSTADCALLPGTTIELWQCQQDGLYDMLSEEMHYRCRVQTGDYGRVELITLRPPSYGEPDKRIQAHIHLKVTHPEHEPLITQLRFVNDPDDNGSTPAGLYLDPEVLEDGSQEARFMLALRPLA